MTLEVRDLEVRRGRLAVLSGVSLDVAAGSRVALIGHNGAGKTTLMKAALGLLPLAAGDIRVAGAAPGSAVARAATAYLPENVAFHPALTGREALTLFARLRKAAGQVGPMLERVGLAAAADRRIATYSKGMRQRLGLAQALLGRPRLAVLDEPTSGLDPVSRAEFYAHVDALAGQGTAVLISSHALTELEARTDRIAILAHGRLVADDTLAALRRRAGLETRLRGGARAEAAAAGAAALDGTRVNGQAVDLVCPPGGKLAALARIAALGEAVEDVEVAPPDLEALYRHFSAEDRP